MKCVTTCDFIGVINTGHICKYHKVPIKEENGRLQRCVQCENHAYYNKLITELGEVLNEYNTFVVKMDAKIDNLHILMSVIKEKI